MAGIVTAPDFVDRLVSALRADMPEATIDAEHVRDRRYRFLVIWQGFTGRDHRERQQRVWEVADRTIPGKDLLDVGMIITMSPDEAQLERAEK